MKDERKRPLRQPEDECKRGERTRRVHVVHTAERERSSEGSPERGSLHERHRDDETDEREPENHRELEPRDEGRCGSEHERAGD